MINNKILCSACGLIALSLMPQAASAFSVTGDGKIFDPPIGTDITESGETSRQQVGFIERQNVTTTQDYFMWGNYVDESTLPPVITLNKGSHVNSYMIFLNKPDRITGRVETSATWTFDHKILGIMGNYDGSHEVASTDELGKPGLIYQASPIATRGLQVIFDSENDNNPDDGVPFPDSYEILGNTLTLNMNMKNNGVGDYVRVITQVPEPLTILGTGLALGFGGIFKSKMSKKTGEIG